MSDAERTRNVPFLAAALLLLAPCTLHAQVQYPVPVHQTWPQPYPPPPTVTVDPSGGGNYTTITAAVNAVASGTYIRVKAGIYQEYNIDFGSKQLVLESVDGVGAAILEPQHAWPLPCGQLQSIFRLTQGQTGASAINGFTLRNGRASRGGAIYCYGTSPTIINNIFSNNSAALGGAVFSQFGSPQIAGNTFTANGYGNASSNCGTDAFEGGAICLVSSGAVVAGNLFQSNRATLGGGIDLATNSHVTLSNNIFAGNFGASGNPSTGNGGGLSVNTGSAAFVEHCEFNFNHATASGGGAWLSGTSGYPTQFDHVVFLGNAADQTDGGGLHCDGASGAFTNCTFDQNTCEHWGGGIYCSGPGSPVFDFCELKNNLATRAGGGAAFAFDNSATIRRSQIHDNDVQAGGGFAMGGGIYVEAASVTIRQNTITGNGRNTTTLGNKCWRGGGIAYVGGTSPASQGRIDANVITLNEVKAYPGIAGEAAGVYLKNMGAGSTFGSNVVALNTANNIPGVTCYGAGVLLDGTGPFRFYNNTIAYNTNGVLNNFGRGGGILFRTISQQFFVDNTIVWANLAQLDPSFDSLSVSPVPMARHCSVSNGVTSTWSADAFTLALIGQYPNFVNPTTGNYHIQVPTAMLDAGDNTPVNMTIRPTDIDMDGSARITNYASGGIVDIGADEL